MKKLTFFTNIKAPREKVWNTMLGDKTYRIWTEAFNPGSYFEGDWSEGSKILFLGPDPKDGTTGGMVSRIAKNIPYEYVSIQHLGMVSKGVEDTTSEEVKKWTPAFENYTFKDADGGTDLLIEVDTAEEYADMFSGIWPKALEKLKELCEK